MLSEKSQDLLKKAIKVGEDNDNLICGQQSTSLPTQNITAQAIQPVSHLPGNHGFWFVHQ